MGFVKNESGVLAESCDSVNITNASLQCYIAYKNDGIFI